MHPMHPLSKNTLDAKQDALHPTFEISGHFSTFQEIGLNSSDSSKTK